MIRSLALALVLATGLVLAPAGAGGPAETGQERSVQARELGGLRARPGLPVASVALRAGARAHHGALAGKGGKCDKDVDLTGWYDGISFVAAQDNTICTNADLDVYTTSDGTNYVVQAGGEKAAWTHTRIGATGTPTLVSQFRWAGRGGKGTYTPDIKGFRQGSSHYIAMGLERITLAGYCGVVIVNVTNPNDPVLESQFIGADWCDTHNVFVENDSSGEGKYVYATADNTHDLRVLQIKDGGASVAKPIEIGRYRAPTANSNNYVHDVTVIDHGGTLGRRAYLAYWDTGTVILNAAQVTPGTNPDPLGRIDPDGFLAHHAYPNAAGTRVFIEDEITYSAGFEPVQMWNISNPGSPLYVDGIAPNVGKGGELLPAHNLHVDGSTLYVGWYKAGMQAFTFDETGIDDMRFAYHQVQTENRDDDYDGAWGVRLLKVGTTTYVLQSDRRYGLIVDRLNSS